MCNDGGRRQSASGPRSAIIELVIGDGDRTASRRRGGQSRWLARMGPLDAICLGGIGAGVAWSWLSLLLTPALLGTRPVLLEALQGSTSAMVAAGAFARVGRAALWLALAAAVVGLMVFDPFIWWAGRRYGRAVLAWYSSQVPARAAGLARAERAFARWGAWTLVTAYYLPVPNSVLYLAAGASGMPLWRFLAFDLVGSLLWAAVLVGLGFAIGQRAVQVATLISHYSWQATVALVVVVAAVAWWRGRRRSAARDRRS